MKPTATSRDTYIAKAADIQNKIAQLQQQANEHFGHNPDVIHWGHVGDLNRVQELLDQILEITILNEKLNVAEK
ncbi:hypothetical protein [Ferrovum sp.]|uniref:hypothetical protein n=1 Tax=Ferrovum sp. TaxID=2609467 RepID=UPI002616CE63|nr:hypothetical protein [Ferrovum sp.]